MREEVLGHSEQLLQLGLQAKLVLQGQAGLEEPYHCPGEQQQVEVEVGTGVGLLKGQDRLEEPYHCPGEQEQVEVEVVVQG